MEFIGLPASGKSTIAAEIFKYGEIGGKKVYYPLHELYKKPWWERNLWKLFNILTFVILNPVRALKIIYMIIGSRQKRLVDNFRLCINSLFIFKVVEKYDKSSEIILIDEGLLHHSWAIKVGAKNNFNSIRYMNVSRNKPNKLNVVYVKSSIDTLLKRMESRGNINDRHREIKENINFNEQKMKECISVLPDESVFVLNNSDSNELRDNVEKVFFYLNHRC